MTRKWRWSPGSELDEKMGKRGLVRLGQREMTVRLANNVFNSAKESPLVSQLASVTERSAKRPMSRESSIKSDYRTVTERRHSLVVLIKFSYVPPFPPSEVFRSQYGLIWQLHVGTYRKRAGRAVGSGRPPWHRPSLRQLPKSQATLLVSEFEVWLNPFLVRFNSMRCVRAYPFGTLG